MRAITVRNLINYKILNKPRQKDYVSILDV